MGKGVDAGRGSQRWREVEREQRVVNNEFRCDLDIRDGNLAGRAVGIKVRNTVGGFPLRACIGAGNGDDGDKWLIRGKSSASRLASAQLFHGKADSFGHAYRTSPAQADDGIDLVLISKVGHFSYLESGNMRLDMFVGRYQAIA